MFYGRFEHNIDTKGRMTVPSIYRDQTPGNVVFITKGLDGNLMAYPKPAFEIIAQTVSSKSLTDPGVRSFKREILGYTAELAYDTAGRILIPSFLRKFAGIEDQVVIVGVGDSFEVWSPDRLAAKEEVFADPEANQDRWVAFDISTRGN
ncbi:MAG TPA: division/cell wall cluster transcriptional repressor MraZ [Anaerolineaceae bacterium]|nr:division/cell wall cluster transcriptional repressor MraZ [Anaerolineaceae bacterium]